MREMPRQAKCFLAVIYAVGVLSVFWVSVLPAPPFRAPLWEFGLFLVLAGLAGGAKVTLMRCKRAEDVGSMSLGFAITFAALLHLGPVGGLWVGLTSTLSSCLLPR